MVVVAIIGILAVIAIPRFRIFQAKARQAEAKYNLSHIYTLQHSYYGEYDKYATIAPPGVGAPIFGGGPNSCPPNVLGFSISPCSAARYNYHVIASSDGSGFLAHAYSGTGVNNKVLRGCLQEGWTINHNKEIKNYVRDVTKNCSGPPSGIR